MDIKGFREKYPQYNDLSDSEVADNLHKRHYSDMDKDSFYKKFGVQTTTAGETAVDALIGAGSGITRAVTDIPSLPADAASLGRMALEKLGASPEAIQRGRDYISRNPVASGILGASRAYRDEIENPTNAVTGALKSYRDYDPETNIGKYAKTTGEFAGGLVGGKKGIVERGIKYVAAPAIASEAAGQATEGSDLEPLARGVAGLVGMSAASAIRNPAAQKRLVNKLPQAEDFEKVANDAYDVLDKSRITVRNSKVSDMFDGLEKHLAKEGFVPGVDDKATGVLNFVQKEMTRGNMGNITNPPMRFRDLDNVSKVIGKKAADAVPGSGDRRILFEAKKYWDDAIQNIDEATDINIPQMGLPNGMVERVQGAIKTAKKNWKQKAQTETLDEITRLGKLTGDTNYTRGGEQLGTQREFLKFIKKPINKRQSYSPEVLRSFEKVARGGTAGPALRNFGRLANSGASAFQNAYNAGTIGGALGFATGGPVGAMMGATAGIGIPIVGRVARNMSMRSTGKAIADAQSLVRTGKKLDRGYNSPLARLLALQALGNQSAQSQNQ